jgi:hypothetical protein
VFASRKVLAALLITDHGHLVSVIERGETETDLRDQAPAWSLGRISGRVTTATTPLAEARRVLDDTGGRRLAVVDERGALLGLLCLNRKRTGYCSDDDVDARARERAELAHAGHGVGDDV